MSLEHVTESIIDTKRMEKQTLTCVLRLALLARHDNCEEETSKNTLKRCSCVPLRLKRNHSHIDVCFFKYKIILNKVVIQNKQVHVS